MHTASSLRKQEREPHQQTLSDLHASFRFSLRSEFDHASERKMSQLKWGSMLEPATNTSIKREKAVADKRPYLKPK
jgi:hypothetical protein